MIVTPVVDHGIVLGQNAPGYVRGAGLHMSTIYNAMYEVLEPKRFDKSKPMDVHRLELGMALEESIERAVADRLIASLAEGSGRPGELVEPEHGIIYSPDLFLFNSHFRLGEIKLTWLSSKEVPRVAGKFDAFPPKFDKYFCPDPQTPTVRDDLTVCELADIREGDRLLGFDEYPQVSSFRRLLHTTVKTVAYKKAPCVRIELSDGSKIVCTEDHYWLGKFHSQAQWLSSQMLLRSDQKIGHPRKGHASLLRVVPNSWSSQLTSTEQGWLAGIFDGEGNLAQGIHGTLRLSVAQNPGLVLSEIERLLNKDGYVINRVEMEKCIQLLITRQSDILRFLATIRPFRLLEKFKQLERIGTLHYESIQVVDRISLGLRTVACVETTTGTYLASGFASHNTQMKLYCRCLDTPYARLIAFFVNGQYEKGRVGNPELLVWDIEFSPRELKEEWDTIIGFARSKGWV